MTTVDLNQSHTELIELVSRLAEHTGESQQSAFFGVCAEMASENGDCGDLEYTPVRKDGNRGYQIDGYSIDQDRGEAHLAICDYDPADEVRSANLSDIDALFRKLERFFQNALTPEFINALEESSPAFQAAYPIYSLQTRIKRIRLIIFTNAKLAVRSKKVDSKKVEGRTFTYNVLDLSRYADIENAQGQHEPIEIDISELNGGPLPCIEAHTEKGYYKAYLAAIPGTLLCEIYGRYGARLLEQNVRAFLQARGKVNQGIIKTILNEPEMFFAYNNGLSATASGIELARSTSDTSLGIKLLKDFQIVNGGQTTASLLYAKDNPPPGAAPDFLSRIYVQMKLSIIEPGLAPSVVPNISKFANSQNKVSESDLFSNHPFHLEMEKISRRLLAPPAPGSMATSKWFYERARGQYRNELNRGKRRFESEFPKDQVLDKTEFAKVEMTFMCRPDQVSKGAQKCFSEFADQIDGDWNANKDQFNDLYFKRAVSKAIIMAWTDQMIGTSSWYKDDRGYKAQILCYTVAWLVHHVRDRLNSELDLDAVWKSQGVPDELRQALAEVAPRIADAIKQAPSEIRNISEYCKRPVCWTNIKKMELKLSPSITKVLKSKWEVKDSTVDAMRTRKIDQDIEFETELFELAGKTGPIVEFAKRRKLLTETTERALDKVHRGKTNLTKLEKDALKLLFKRMEDLGA
jgi:hypothetical protein